METLGPVLVAVVLFLIMGTITIAAIRKYEFSQVLKIWNAQIGVFGVMIGMIGTYFFAHASIQNSNRERETAIAQRDQVRNELTVALASAKTPIQNNAWESLPAAAERGELATRYKDNIADQTQQGKTAYPATKEVETGTDYETRPTEEKGP